MRKPRKKTKGELVSDGMNLLSNQYRKDKNSIRINIHNSLKHEMAKLVKVYELIQDGYQVITEARFKNGRIADIYVPETQTVYEILQTEKKKEAFHKTSFYPQECLIWLLDADEIIKEGFEQNFKKKHNNEKIKTY